MMLPTMHNLSCDSVDLKPHPDDTGIFDEHLPSLNDHHNHLGKIQRGKSLNLTLYASSFYQGVPALYPPLFFFSENQPSA